MDKLKRLILMTQHPERYTDEQWREVFDGETLADEQIEAEWQQFEQSHFPASNSQQPASTTLHRAMSTGEEQAKSISEKAPAQQNDASFFARHSSLMKVAASLIGILMLSGITLAAIHIVRTAQQPTASAQQSTPTVQHPTSDILPNDSSLYTHHSPLQTIVFEDAELQQIADSLATFYRVSPAFRNASTRHLRLFYEWDQQARIGEIINELNHFDHVSISLKGDSIIFE